MARSSTLGIPLSTFSCHNFSGGLDVTTEPIKLADLGRKNKWLTVATNVVYNPDGSVARRWGMVQKSEMTSAVGDTRIMGGFEFVRSTGTRYNLIQAGAVVYLVLSDLTLSSVKTGLTPTYVPSWAVYNDTLFYANGVDAPQQYDGTTWAALGGSSPATTSVLVSHGNRLFGLATAVPSRLYWSKLNNAVDWSGTTDAGFLDVNPNDGAGIIALAPSIQELVILKKNRPYRLQGIGPATGYTVVDNLVPATGSIGATTSNASAFAVNTVFYGSQMGIHALSATQAYGDLTETFISRQIEPYFRQNTAYSPYDSTAYQGYSGKIDSPAIVYDARNNLLMCGQNASAATNSMDRLLVYDLNAEAWSLWHTHGGGIAGAFSCLFPSQSTTFIPEMRIGLYDIADSARSVLAAFRRDRTVDVGIVSSSVDTAIAITGQVRHVSNLGESDMEKTPRRMFLYFKEESGDTTITLNLYADFRTTAAFTTTFVIGSATSESQIVKRIDLGGFRCEYLEMDIQGSGPFTFFGYEVQFRDRRRIRRAE